VFEPHLLSFVLCQFLSPDLIFDTFRFKEGLFPIFWLNLFLTFPTEDFSPLFFHSLIHFLQPMSPSLSYDA